MSQGFIDESVRDESDPDTAELTREFMTVTGAEPLALRSAVVCWPTTARGVTDHPQAWRLDGETVLTIEPYLGNRDCEFVAEAFESAGWRCVPLPRAFGMWAPPRSRLFLVADPSSRADLDAVRARILRAKQPYHAKSRHKDHSLAELVALELTQSDE